MSDDTIGRALRTRRAQLGLDQRDAATRIGMSRTTYSSYERDTQRPSVDVLPAIAEFLEVSIDDVLVLYGASAVAAARTSLARLSHVTPASTDFVVGAAGNVNGNNGGNGNTELSPSDVTAPVVPAHEPGKVSDVKGKSKKKKKKKGKREPARVPAFSTHI